MKTFKLLVLVALVGFSFACTKSQNKDSSSLAGKTLNVYCWSNYIADDVIHQFEEKTKAKVSMNYFSSNEELVAKLQAGAKGYDIVVPSGYTIKALIELKLLEPLGKLDWPELSKLSPRFAAMTFDPQHEYSVPYAWGTTGIAINRKKVKAKVDSWSWLFDTAAHPELKGQITMIDDAPSVVGSALKYLGYAYNESSPEAFEKVKELLIKQKKSLKAYTPETFDTLANGETAISQAYSEDALQVRDRKNADIEYILPKEGGELFVDNLAIPKGAENIALAKEFMHFTLQKEVAFQQLKHLFNGPVIDLTGLSGLEKYSSNPNLFPPKEVLDKFEMMEENPTRIEAIQKLWTELKSL